ncbi:DUF1127 domain-containing protein [Rhizobium sp. SL42]|uniref:DUF1127 domain-containing protein n=1 Tax=Rhizobium sp. SL42 TaxID=2806346 RepID=UPI001F23EC8B|nr:DUF1127 domain-containing protein [Rhizobium sp. SL42]
MVTIDTIPAESIGEPVSAARKRFSVLGALAGLQFRWAKRRSRLALLELNEHQLRDIGITHEEARHEAAKASILPRML